MSNVISAIAEKIETNSNSRAYINLYADDSFSFIISGI
tara:strand:- start:445 stop:558 length:114 start_codon:yes stop_codon:yes gene_type:complete